MEGTDRADDKYLFYITFRRLVHLIPFKPNRDSDGCLEPLMSNSRDSLPFLRRYGRHSHVEDRHADSVQFPGDLNFLLLGEVYARRLLALPQGSIHKVNLIHGHPSNASSCNDRRACPKRDHWLSQDWDERNRNPGTWPLLKSSQTFARRVPFHHPYNQG